MNITQRRETGVLILALSGGMKLGEGDAEVGRAIRSALQSGELSILLDMSEVPLVDSFGIGELVSAFASANKSNASVKLLNLVPRVQDVMMISGLGGVFEIFDDEAAAIASCQA